MEININVPEPADSDRFVINTFGAQDSLWLLVRVDGRASTALYNLYALATGNAMWELPVSLRDAQRRVRTAPELKWAPIGTEVSLTI
jgi:hypothetical protein